MRQTKNTTKTVRPAAAKPRASSVKTKVASRARPAPKSPFNAKDLQRFRQILTEERLRLKEELEEIEARAARALEIEAAGELSGYDEHPADMASETFEREKDLAIGETIASLLTKAQNALAKIDKGTYGICDICTKPIKRARLEAMPLATLCVDCQGRVEAG